MGGLICCIGCLVKPMNFDWNIMLVGGDGGENAKVLGDDVDGTPEALLAAKKWIFKYGWGYSLFPVVLWPLAFVPMGAFGKSTFQIWAGVALMWGWIASMDGMMSAISGKKAPATKTTTVEAPTSAA